MLESARLTEHMGDLSDRYRENKPLRNQRQQSCEVRSFMYLASPAAHALQLSMENAHNAVISKHLTSRDHVTVFRSHKHIKINQEKLAMVD